MEIVQGYLSDLLAYVDPWKFLKKDSTKTACMCTISSYILYKISTKIILYRTERNKRFNVEKFLTADQQKGVLVLHQFSRGKYCPNLSPFALKLEAFLRLSGIPYIVESKVAFGPKGKSPWVNLEGSGRPMGDSQFIVEELTRREKGKEATQQRLPRGDVDLKPVDAAAVEALRIVVEEQLFWVVIYWRYTLDRCKTFLSTQRFPRFLNYTFPLFMVRGIRQKAEMQGLAIHTPEEVFLIGKNVCRILSTFLDDRLFFCGDLPGTADCAIWGGLAQIRWNAPGTEYEALVTEDFPKLAAYCDRMKEKVFGDEWDKLLTEGYMGSSSTNITRIKETLFRD